ncbi:MAG: ABC transporter ATP-binding protein [Phycisphaeraceae bacterium]|nr:ABC transporter ATP-binding protein [Phycisphaeraceae bacterium]MCW5763245.1 ABC transporter ATP-binding protein [Phycisphaeraceae bacterium]
MNATAARPILRVEDLALSFSNGTADRVSAVNGVKLTLYPRQTLAVVGESGCGKSVTALSTLRLIPTPPGRFDRGRILFERQNGQHIDLLALDDRAIREVRGREIAMIFQEPMTSLNPVFTIGDQIIEAITLHQNVNRKQAIEVAAQALTDVGITNPKARLRAYPHEFSGGMRQRVMIAMALACEPRVLLADEPTTALDVTIQAQILDLLGALKQSRDLAIMLITHDLGVVAERADVVCVMYAGRVVEYAPVRVLFDKPMHPYTRGLLACIPRLGEQRDRLETIAQTIADKESFGQIEYQGRSFLPWWPWHTPPEGLNAPALLEVEPQHWVGVWADPNMNEGSFPDIAPVDIQPRN